VEAIKAVAVGHQSNEVDLTVVAPPPPEIVCALPRLTKLTDAAGDNHAVLGIAGPAPAGTDLRSFQIAQPYAADNIIRLAFTINTHPGESPQPFGSAWLVGCDIPDPA